MAQHGLPPFLKQSKNDLHAKWIDLEWQQRNRLLAGSQKAQSEWTRPNGDHVNIRNRYTNVVPYEHNRIRLSDKAGGNDYINASPITLGKRRFIATQGPLEAGINHFYRMLQAQIDGPAVVVMLTQTHESGKEKCFQYYPLSKQEPTLRIPQEPDATDEFHGSVHLTSCEEDAETKSEIRHMSIHTESTQAAASDKELTHFLFSGWPDFLVPEGEDKDALLRLLYRSAQANGTPVEGSSTTQAGSANGTHESPRIIHCSAGVGRSGTFIALDYLLGMLDSGQLDNLSTTWDPVLEAIEIMRQQRMMMVQSEGQFFFIYDVLRERLSERLQSGA